MILAAAVLACTPSTIEFEEPEVPVTPPTEYVDPSDTAPDAPDSWPDSGQAEPEPEHTGVEAVIGLGQDNFIYDNTVVHQIALEIDEESWRALTRNPTTYTEVELSHEGEYFGAVGMRLKGSSTFQSLTSKPSIKLKMNFVDPDAKFYNIRRLTMNNLRYDRSMMAEQLAYMVYREWGVAAPRTGYAWVTINGQDYGLYSIVESMDELIIDQWWEDDSGWMYESQGCDFSNCGCFQEDEPGDDYNGYSELQEICGVASTQGETFYEGIKEPLDWDNFMKFQAVEAVISHWDGYAYNVNNYHVYHEPTLDKWFFLPWSTDLAWGWNPWDSGNCGNYATEPTSYDNGRLTSRCEALPDCRDEMYDYMAQAADLLESLPMQSEIDRLQTLIWPYVEADPKVNYSVGSMAQQVDCLRTWIDARPDFVRSRVSGPPAQ